MIPFDVSPLLGLLFQLGALTIEAAKATGEEQRAIKEEMRAITKQYLEGMDNLPDQQAEIDARWKAVRDALPRATPPPPLPPEVITSAPSKPEPGGTS